jgi:hypothetical protein
VLYSSLGETKWETVKRSQLSQCFFPSRQQDKDKNTDTSHRKTTLYCYTNLIVYISHELPPRRYPYFDVVVGLAWSNDPGSYAGGSIATGRASHARQVEVDDPGRKGYHGLPGWGLVVGLTTSPYKNYFVEKLSKLKEAKVHQGL